MDMKELLGLPLGVALIGGLGLLIWKKGFPLLNTIISTHYAFVRELLAEQATRDRETKREFIAALERNRETFEKGLDKFADGLEALKDIERGRR